MTGVIGQFAGEADNGPVNIDADCTTGLSTDHEISERVFDAFQRVLASPTAPSAAVVTDVLEYCKGYVERCHNRKEEDHLFPLLEARGLPRTGGPLGVLLGEHEQAKSELARFAKAAEAYASGDDVLPALRKAFTGYAGVLRDHFWKENDILFPMARRILDEDDHRRVVAGIAATERAVGPDVRQHYYRLAEHIVTETQVKDLSSALEPDLLAAILNTLPIELSFVDADDRVLYFSHEHHEKIFPRGRGAIGRRVQQCHPPKSVDKVNAILASFKSGQRELAEFWLDLRGRKIHVRYSAVRSPEGTYLGCLETVQDITRIQQLQGERRLAEEALAK
jgi:uncharacterized protein